MAIFLYVGSRGMSAIDAGDEPALPPGFCWDLAWQHADGPPTALLLEGEEVARMDQRITGGWYVLLDRQRPAPPGSPFAPLVVRNCSSFEQGRRGTVMWVLRHEARIRGDVAAKIASRPRHLGTGQ